MSDRKVLGESSKWFLPGVASIGPNVSDKKKCFKYPGNQKLLFPIVAILDVDSEPNEESLFKR